jgi:hypothetical protein
LQPLVDHNSNFRYGRVPDADGGCSECLLRVAGRQSIFRWLTLESKIRIFGAEKFE